MGKKYYCEYCDVRFKDDVKIRNNHIGGLQHQKAKKEHYAKYKSPKEILEEELGKKTCTWFMTGSCQYGFSCHNSHYTPDQLTRLRQQANQMDYEKWLEQQPKQYNRQMIDEFMERRAQRRRQEAVKALQEHCTQPKELKYLNQNEIPPSMQPVGPEAFLYTWQDWGS